MKILTLSAAATIGTFEKGWILENSTDAEPSNAKESTKAEGADNPGD